MLLIATTLTAALLSSGCVEVSSNIGDHIVASVEYLGASDPTDAPWVTVSQYADSECTQLVEEMRYRPVEQRSGDFPSPAPFAPRYVVKADYVEVELAATTEAWQKGASVELATTGTTGPTVLNPALSTIGQQFDMTASWLAAFGGPECPNVPGIDCRYSQYHLSNLADPGDLVTIPHQDGKLTDWYPGYGPRNHTGAAIESTQAGTLPWDGAEGTLHLVVYHPDGSNVCKKPTHVFKLNNSRHWRLKYSDCVSNPGLVYLKMQGKTETLFGLPSMWEDTGEPFVRHVITARWGDDPNASDWCVTVDDVESCGSGYELTRDVPGSIIRWAINTRLVVAFVGASSTRLSDADVDALHNDWLNLFDEGAEAAAVIEVVEEDPLAEECP